MLALARAALAKRDKDAGFTLVELLVVVIIIGILAAIAIPLYMNQKQRGYDATVKSDLKNFATQLETHLASNSSYPTSDIGFTYSSGNQFEILVSPSGTTAGYVIYGTNANSDNVFYVSSYGGSAPVKSEAADLSAVPHASDSLGANAPASFAATISLG